MDAPSETSQSEKPLWISQFDSQDPGLFFRDGKRRIDFVLVYSILDKNTTKARRREEFLRGLAQELIEIEVEDCYGRILGQTAKIPPKEAREPAIQPVAASNLNAAPIRSEKPEDDSDHIEVDRNHPSSMDRYRIQAKQREGVSLGSEDLVFVKLHAPWHVMTLYAEKFNFRKQLNVTQYGDLKKREKTSGRKAGCHCSCSNVNDASLPPLETTLTWPFNRRREFLYEIPPNKDEFFNPVERALVVDYILRRTRFAQRNSCPTEEIQQNPIVGITKLISEGVFLAAYPLHEVSLTCRCVCAGQLLALGCAKYRYMPFVSGSCVEFIDDNEVNPTSLGVCEIDVFSSSDDSQDRRRQKFWICCAAHACGLLYLRFHHYPSPKIRSLFTQR